MRIRLLIIILSCISMALHSHNNLIVAVLMIKNEAAGIEATLQPLVDGGITDFLILDTGSTDDTVEIVKKFFSKCAIKHGIIVQEPFIDFAASRNRALELTKTCFEQNTFMLMLDAEWQLQEVPVLINFCKQHLYDADETYLIRIADCQTEFYTARLIRRTSPAKFVGIIHERLDRPSWIKVPSQVYFKWAPSAQGIEKSLARWSRDKELLLKKYAQDPTDAHAAFYLGQTYSNLGDLEHAYKFYKICTDLKGLDEETFLAHYRLGILAQQSHTQRVNRWEVAMQHYLDAFSLRPHRIEPLIKIAQHYWHEHNMPLCFMFARRALELPYPDQDFFCVEKETYNFTRYELVSACAGYVGAYDIGEAATKQALKIHPELAHLQNNLASYVQCKSNALRAKTHDNRH